MEAFAVTMASNDEISSEDENCILNSEMTIKPVNNALALNANEEIPVMPNNQNYNSQQTGKF